ncbi:hypothetical protein FACS189447_07520 [Spirochaetia bacterium]|nr:hypothetical protein FACS189447_07520 [Spirochaetia bacterium]
MTGKPDFPTPEARGFEGAPLGSVESLKFFQRLEDFMDYFEPIIERFPAYERYALNTQIKNCMNRMYEKTIRTNSSKNKLPGWYDIDVDLKILRGYVRRSRKRGSKYLSIKSYETACKRLSEIGKLLGGLIKRG